MDHKPNFAFSYFNCIDSLEKSSMDKEKLITSSVANEELNEICEKCK